MRYTPVLPQENVNVSKRTPFRTFLFMLAGLVLGMCTILAVIVFTVDMASPYIPATVEEWLGEDMLANLQQHASKGQQAKRVKRVLGMLTPYLSDDDHRLTYKPLVIEEDVFNAFAAPGGTIVVFTGLLDEMENDDELAFVLAHELGHFHGRDHLRGLGLTFGSAIMNVLLTGHSSGATDLAKLATDVFGLTFSRTQERKADLFALELLAQAGLPLSGGPSFMTKTSAMDDRSKLDEYMSTHPLSSERLLYLQGEVERLESELGG